MEKKHGEEIHKEYTHIMFMNSSVCRSFSIMMIKMIDRTFLKKLEDEDSVVCSPVINFLDDTDGGPGPDVKPIVP